MYISFENETKYTETVGINPHLLKTGLTKNVTKTSDIINQSWQRDLGF